MRWIICGGGAKGMLAPSQIIGEGPGSLAPPQPPPPLPTPMPSHLGQHDVQYLLGLAFQDTETIKLKKIEVIDVSKEI